MPDPARRFFGGLQNKGVAAWCGRFQRAIGAVVDLGVGADLREIATDQGEVMFVVQTPDVAYAIQRVFGLQATADGIARVGGINDHAAFTDDIHRLLDQARLWGFGVY